MLKTVYVVIRYSILSRSANNWAMQKGVTYEAYKDELFDPLRLKAHEELFSKFTIPSLKKLEENCPDDIEFKTLVVTSESLPSVSKKSLSTLLGELDNSKIIAVDENTSFSAAVCEYIESDLVERTSENSLCVTIRLDDDDALADDYLSQLNDYLTPSFSGFYISFPKGYRANFLDDESIVFAPFIYRMCAQGIAFVETFRPGVNKIKGVFQTNHITADERFPAVVDSRRFSYIRAVHIHSSIYTQRKDKVFRFDDSVEPEEVQKRFSWIKNMETDKSDKKIKKIVTDHGTYLAHVGNPSRIKQIKFKEAVPHKKLLIEEESGRIKTEDGYYISFSENEKPLFTKNKNHAAKLIKTGNKNKYVISCDNGATYLSAHRKGTLRVVTEANRWEFFRLV